MIWRYAVALLSLCFSTFLGYGVLRIVLAESMRRLSWYELIGYSFALGLGVIAAAIMVMSSSSVEITFLPMLGLVLLPIASVVLVKVGRRRGAQAHAILNGGQLPDCIQILPRGVLVAVLLAAVAVVFVGSLAEPIAEVDATAAWAFHAKVFFYERTVQPAYLTDGGCGRSLSHWPPLYPLAQTWTHMAMGTYDDLRVKITFPLYFLAVLGIIYGSLKCHFPRSYCLAMLVILATVPALVVPFPAGSVASGYADLPLALFFAAAASALVWWVSTGNGRVLLLAAVYASLGMWVKREGLAFAGICTASVWLFWLTSHEKRRANGIRMPITFALVCGASLLLQYLHRLKFVGPFFCEVVNGDVGIPGGAMVKFAELSAYLLLEVANPSRWGFLWLLAILLVILRYRAIRHPVAALLLFLIAGQIAATLIFMLLDPCSAKYHAMLNMRRVLIHLAPIATLFVGIAAAVPENRAA